MLFRSVPWTSFPLHEREAALFELVARPSAADEHVGPRLEPVSIDQEASFLVRSLQGSKSVPDPSKVERRADSVVRERWKRLLRRMKTLRHGLLRTGPRVNALRDVLVEDEVGRRERLSSCEPRACEGSLEIRRVSMGRYGQGGPKRTQSIVSCFARTAERSPSVRSNSSLPASTSLKPKSPNLPHSCAVESTVSFSQATRKDA